MTRSTELPTDPRTRVVTRALQGSPSEPHTGEGTASRDPADGGHVGYSGTQAAHIVGVSYRQLDYWARTGLIRPSLAEATGSGTRRRYSYRDLLELRVIKTLLDAGIRLESVREVFIFLRKNVSADISSAHIVISGSQVVLCDSEELVDVLRRGQGVLNVLPLSGVKDDLDAQLVPQPAGNTETA